MMRYISFIFMLGFSQILLAVEVYEPGKITFSENGVSYEGKHLFKIDGEALNAFHQLVQDARNKKQNIAFWGDSFPDATISEQEFIGQNFLLMPPRNGRGLAVHIVSMEAERMDPCNAKEDTEEDINRYFTEGLAANELAANPLAANQSAANPSAADPSAADQLVANQSAADPSAADPSAADQLVANKLFALTLALVMTATSTVTSPSF